MGSTHNFHGDRILSWLMQLQFHFLRKHHRWTIQSIFNRDIPIPIFILPLSDQNPTQLPGTDVLRSLDLKISPETFLIIVDNSSGSLSVEIGIMRFLLHRSVTVQIRLSCKAEDFLHSRLSKTRAFFTSIHF